MENNVCKVTLQAVSEDLKVSTGEFNDIIEYGFISTGEMKPISQKQKDNMVRMKDIAPTSGSVSQRDIDIGTASSQISAHIWKSKNWKDWKNISLGIGFFFVLFAPIMLLDKPDYGTSGILVLISVPFFFIATQIKKKGYTIFKLGFDWKTNTIWTLHGDDFDWNKNANTILDFHILKDVENTSGSAGVVLVTDGAALGNSNEINWVLLISRKNNSDRAIAAFATKKEANDVLNKSQILLSKFN